MQSFPGSPPAGFRYMQAFLSGRPKHAALDAFSLKHPSMDPGQRAKIFAPFDALCGFSDAVSAKEVVYEPFREMDEDRSEMLNRKLSLLRALLMNGKAAGKKRVVVEVTWFCPCDDPDSEHFEILGQYRTCTGVLNSIDPVRWLLQLDGRVIDLDDIYDIRDPEGRLFGPDGEGWAEGPDGPGGEC